MPKKVIRYRDLDLSLRPHPVTGDINILKDIEAVKASVKNLVLTNFWERPFQPKLGSNVRANLFENMDLLTEISVRDDIIAVLNKHEPRIELIEVVATATEDENRLAVKIKFSIINLVEPITIALFLKRVR